MSETVITSVAEFRARLQELESDEAGFLYRGQADATWPVSCSAARRLTQDPTNPIEDQLINSLLVGYLEFLIAKPRMRDFLPPGFSATSSDLELLAQLQHQGAATGLIDFTRQPSVALWFACNEHDTTDGAVYVFARSATEEISNSRDLEKKIQSFYEEGTLWSWEPSARGNRIVAQSSVFVFGVATVASHRMRKFIIRADRKRAILTQLKTVYDINEEMLFSDFPGYAVANAANKVFDIKHSVSYWREQVELASDDSSKAMAYFYCGVAYSAVQDFQNATEQYSEAIRLNPEYTNAYTNRGIAKDALERFEDAIADFNEAIRIDLQNDKAYNGRASSKAALGRYEEAIADYNEAIRINPEYAKAYNHRGADKDALGRHAEAIADYDAAIRINPEFAEAFFNRGSAKANLGRHAEAIADYDEAIRINPEFVEAYFNRGNAKANLGWYEEAVADYDEAIRIRLGFAKAYFNRGKAKFILGLRKDAISDYDKVIRINPEHVEAYNNRGKAKKSLRQYAAAEEDFKRAQTLAQQQGRAELLQFIGRELDNLYPKPFQIVPHRSGYVEGVDPKRLKEILCDMDDDRFIENNAQ